MEPDQPRDDFEDDPDLIVPFSDFPGPPEDPEEEPEEDPPSLEEEFPGDAYQDVLGLMWLGHLERQFTYGGHHFVIRTLKLGEELAVSQVIDEWKDTLGLGKAGTAATVAAALERVDHQPLHERLNRDVTANIRDKFLAIINEDNGWYWPMVEIVFNEYSSLQLRQAELFNDLQSK
jgi:hypothetical protein